MQCELGGVQKKLTIAESLRQFFRASTSIRQWAENEFAEVHTYNNKTHDFELAQPLLLL